MDFVKFKQIFEYFELWLSTKSGSGLINLRDVISLEKDWDTAEKVTEDSKDWKSRHRMKPYRTKFYTRDLMHSQFMAKVSTNNLNLLGRKKSWMHFLDREGLSAANIMQLSKRQTWSQDLSVKEFPVNTLIPSSEILIRNPVDSSECPYSKKINDQKTEGDGELTTKRTKEEGFTY